MDSFIWALVLGTFAVVLFTYTFRKAPLPTIGIFILLWCSPVLTVLISGWLLYTILSLMPSLLLKGLISLLSKIKNVSYRRLSGSTRK